MHCRIVSGIPGLYPLHVSNNLLPNCDSKKCPQIFPNVPVVGSSNSTKMPGGPVRSFSVPMSPIVHPSPHGTWGSRILSGPGSERQNTWPPCHMLGEPPQCQPGSVGSLKCCLPHLLAPSSKAIYPGVFKL